MFKWYVREKKKNLRGQKGNIKLYQKKMEERTKSKREIRGGYFTSQLVKVPFCISVLGLNTWLCFRFYLIATASHGRKHEMAWLPATYLADWILGSWLQLSPTLVATEHLPLNQWMGENALFSQLLTRFRLMLVVSLHLFTYH